MAGEFTLRQSGDEQNPYLTRFYGDGITAGLLTMYLQNAVGNRTALLTLISQGARDYNDPGCGDIQRVIYAGFEIPQFDSNGQPNWIHHNGVATRHPVYRVCSFNGATNVITFTAPHGYNNGDPVAFHVRGVNAGAHMPVAAHVKYFVRDKTSTTLKLSLTAGGAAIDFAADSAGDTFGYLANTGFFDADQGRPVFFPNLNFTFSRKNYIELLLPPELSTGTDAPTRSKIKCRGKLVYDLVEVEDGSLFITGDAVDRENPALVSFDFLKGDLKLPYSRFNASSWLAWRARCDEQIDWVGGNNLPAPVIVEGHANVTYDPDANSIEKTGGVDGNFDAYAFTPQYTAKNATLEFRYLGGEMWIAFTDNNTYTAGAAQGVYIQNNLIYWTDEHSNAPIGEIFSSDSVRISFEYGFLKIYRNNINMPFDADANQRFGTFWALMQFRSAGAKIDQIKYTPSGTVVEPTKVNRFYGDMACSSPTFAGDAFEAQISLCPGTSWQDVDGEIKILTVPDRDVIYTFTKNNTKNLALKERALTDTLNYWRYKFRNKLDSLFTSAIIPIIRRNLMALIGRKSEGAIAEYQVLTQSQMERIGETIARTTADSTFGYDVTAFLDSLALAKGDFCQVIDELSGHTEELPALCVVMTESLDAGGEIETRDFDIAATTSEFYSDTAHGPTQPRYNAAIISNFVPPPVAVDLALTEYNYRLDDGTFLPSIQGVVTFAAGVSQRGKVFTKFFEGFGISLTPDHTADKFTVDAGDIASINNNDVVSLLAPNDGDALPGAFTRESKYYVVNKNSGAHTFQLSKTLGGGAVPFSDNGIGEIRMFPFGDWIYTEKTVTPDASTSQAPFEIQNLPVGFYLVRVATYTLADITGMFDLQITGLIEVNGDTSEPEAPATAAAIYDGLLVTWSWPASISKNVAGYYITDATGVVIQKFINALSFAETLQSANVTRRIFAVSRSGVRGSTYVEITITPGVTNLPSDIQTATTRGNIGLDGGGIYTGKDTGYVPTNVVIPSIDSQLVVGDIVQVNIAIEILNENVPSSNAYSIDRVALTVFNQFGETVKVCTPQPFNRAGYIKATYSRKYADAFEQAFYKIQVRNKFGYNTPIYLAHDGSLSLTAPAMIARTGYPTELSAVAVDSTTVRLAFTATGNVDVWRRVVDTLTWINHANNVSSPYDAGALASTSRYEFWVYSHADTSKRSNIVRIQPLQVPLPPAARVAPSSLSLARDPSDPMHSIIATWIRGATDNTDVEVWLDGAFAFYTGDATTITHTFGSLSEGQTITVDVRNVWSGAPTTSDFAGAQVCTTDVTPPSSSAPTIDSISYDPTTQQVTVYFTPHGGAGTFKLRYSAEQFGSYSDVAGATAIDAGATSVTILRNPGSENETDWYKIARNDVGAPDYSAPASVEIPAPDAATSPTELIVAATDGNHIPVFLAWRNRGATGYNNIERRNVFSGGWGFITNTLPDETTSEDDLAAPTSGLYQWRVWNDSVPGVYTYSEQISISIH